MSNINLVKAISVDEQLAKFAHDKHHIDTLVTMYPDLKVYQSSDLIIDFYSTSVNSQTDDAIFNTINVAGYTHFHYAFPIKNIKISCPYCEGNLVVHSVPSRIPLFVFYGSQYGTMAEHFLNVIVYEDICKYNNISQDVIGKCHIYILNWITEYSKTGNVKLDLTYLNQSVKRLLPFT